MNRRRLAPGGMNRKDLLAFVSLVAPLALGACGAPADSTEPAASTAAALSLATPSFQNVTERMQPTAVVDAVFGDFNGDGSLDVVLLHRKSDAAYYYLEVQRGDGRGHFLQGAAVPFGDASGHANMTKLLVGDFDGDHALDVATLDAGLATVYVAYGSGAGGIRAMRGFEAPTHASVAVAGDFNRDGRTDIALEFFETSISRSVVGTMTAAPGGALATPQIWTYCFTGGCSYDFGNGRLAYGDFDGDGIEDLVVAASGYEQPLVLMRGDGAGNFTPVSTTTTITDSADGYGGPLLAADLDGDGRPEVAQQTEDSVDAFELRADGAFAKMTSVLDASSYPGQNRGMLAADINDDGATDLVTWSSLSDGTYTSFFARLGFGDGTFAPQIVFAKPSGRTLGAARDINGDGRTDLFVVPESEVAQYTLMLGK